MTARYNSSDNTLKEISQMEKPVRPDQRDYDQVSLGGLIYDADLKKYFLDSDKYNAHIASLRTLPCHPSCKTVWKEGDVLTQNKDYNLYRICAIPGGCFDDLACGTCEVQAWPVTVKSEDKEYWEDVVIKVENYLKIGKKLKDMVYDFQKEYSLSRKQ